MRWTSSFSNGIFSRLAQPSDDFTQKMLRFCDEDNFKFGVSSAQHAAQSFLFCGLAEFLSISLFCLCSLGGSLVLTHRNNLDVHFKPSNILFLARIRNKRCEFVSCSILNIFIGF